MKTMKLQTERLKHFHTPRKIHGEERCVDEKSQKNRERGNAGFIIRQRPKKNIVHQKNSKSHNSYSQSSLYKMSIKYGALLNII